jgi:hypothetical protein
MADPAVTCRMLQVEHIALASVRAAPGSPTKAKNE